MAQRTVAAEFRAARKRSGLSQRGVAVVAGVSQAAARNLEAGRIGTDIRVVRKLLAAVGLTFADLEAILPPERLNPPPAPRGRPKAVK